jgi:hypothetical protein
MISLRGVWDHQHTNGVDNKTLPMSNVVFAELEDRVILLEKRAIYERALKSRQQDWGRQVPQDQADKTMKDLIDAKFQMDSHMFGDRFDSIDRSPSPAAFEQFCREFDTRIDNADQIKAEKSEPAEKVEPIEDSVFTVDQGALRDHQHYKFKEYPRRQKYNQ